MCWRGYDDLRRCSPLHYGKTKPRSRAQNDCGERFNIDGATNGGINYPADEYYRTWPKPLSDAEMETGEFLKSLTPEEELATFLLARGMCLHANKRLIESRASIAEAHRLMPQAKTLVLA